MPDGKAVLYTKTTDEDGTSWIALTSLENGASRTLLEGRAPSFSPTGHLVFFRGQTLWAVAFDAGKREISGDPMPIARGARAGDLDFGQGVAYDIANEASLVYEVARGDSGAASDPQRRQEVYQVAKQP